MLRSASSNIASHISDLIAGRENASVAVTTTASVGRSIYLVLLLSVFPVIHGCAYFGGWMNQVGYRLNQQFDPSQRNLKHMIEKSTFLVYGRIRGNRNQQAGSGFTIAAYSDAFGQMELVDTSHIANVETHYGLNLPAGNFSLLVFGDQNHNRKFDKAEVIGQAKISLHPDAQPDHIVADVDIHLGAAQSVTWLTDFPNPRPLRQKESLFYPKGTIRDLNDPLFDSQNALLGLYDPAAFLELAPTMFYALEEDSYKIPVVFVHGIGGSARQFSAIVDQLDRQRYQPWFFYYPSGLNLGQLATLFYDLFLSGRVNPRGRMPIILVAHSMGGLVVREALNHYQGDEAENRPFLLITLATPFGGHPVAAKGVERAPMVIPSWRDLAPQSEFISNLFRQPLKIDHHLLYATGRTTSSGDKEASDGVVPVANQLFAGVVERSSQQLGIRDSHSGILQNDRAVKHILQAMDKVESFYPESHLKILAAGGYDIDLDDRYSDLGKHTINTSGKFLTALGNGSIGTLGDAKLQRFVSVVQGERAAETDAEKDWLRFLKQYPQYQPNVLESSKH